MAWMVVLVMPSTSRTCLAYVICNNSTKPEEGTVTLCPSGSICCPLSNGDYGCLVFGKKGNSGVCCVQGGGGCGSDYQCGSVVIDEHNNQKTMKLRERTWHPVCIKKPEKANTDDPMQLPRYSLCSVPSKALQTVYTLPVTSSSSTSTPSPIIHAIYRSTMGSLEDIHRTESISSRIDTIIVAIHDDSQSADQYLCSANGALPKNQQDPSNSTILVLTPWFLTRSDLTEAVPQVNTRDTPSMTDRSLLTWRNEFPLGEQYPNIMISPSWSYGFDSIHGHASSFAVLDHILDYVQSMSLPRLKRIVVSGHGSGGQFVQRWAVLSNQGSFMWRKAGTAAHNNNPAGHDHNESKSGTPSLRIVVANPHSFLYLDGQRYSYEEGHRHFEVPSPEKQKACPLYNYYGWGLNLDDENGYTPIPYVHNALREAGGVEAVVERYAQRPVLYLSSGLDLLDSSPGRRDYTITCMDLMQGGNRLWAARFFYQHLQSMYTNSTLVQTGDDFLQMRLEAPMVDHDHSLLYSSEVGQIALLGTDDQVRAIQKQQQWDPDTPTTMI